MARRLLLLIVGLFASPAFSQLAGPQFDAKLTYQSPASSIRTIVHDLSVKTGIAMEVHPGLKDEIVLVNVHDARIGELLRRLSDVTASQWQMNGSSLTLIRSSSKCAADLQFETSQSLAILQKHVSQTKASLASKLDAKQAETVLKDQRELSKQMRSGWNQTFYERSRNLNDMQPGERLTNRILMGLDLRELAAVRSGDRLVFSTAPNRMQRPLGSKVLEALRLFTSEQAAWSEAMAKMPPEPGQDAEAGQTFVQDEAISEIVPTKPPSGALVIVTRQGAFGMSALAINVVVFDAEGGVVFRGGSQASGYETGEMMFQAKPAATPDPNDPELMPSPLSQAVLKSFFDAGMESGAASSGVKGELREKLMAPERFDPLSMVGSELFLQMADLKKINLVASLPDTAFMVPMFLGQQQGVRLSLLMGIIEKGQFLRAKSENGWMMLGPINPAEARRTRADRAALGVLLAKIQNLGRITLDDLAQYAITVDEMDYSNLAFWIVSLLFPNDRNSLFSRGSWNAIKLYGRLDLGQRQMLAAHGKLPFTSMDPKQLAIVYRMVFGAEGRVDITVSEPPPPVISGTTSQGDSPDLEGDDLNSEPTIALPEGLPRDGYLTMSGADSDVLFPIMDDAGKNNFGTDFPVEVEAVAWQVFAKERPDLFPWNREQPSFERFRLGNCRTTDLALTFTPKVSLLEQLRDYTVRDKGPLTIDKLPANLKKRLLDAVAQQREQYKDAKPGDIGGEGGGTPPPPPR